MEKLSSDEVGKRLGAARLKRRGKRLPQFLAANFEAFVGHLSTRPSWREVADMLDEMGVRDGHGNSPTPDAVRQAWTRLRKQKSFDAAAPPNPPPVRLLPISQAATIPHEMRPIRPAAPSMAIRSVMTPQHVARSSADMTGAEKLAAATRKLRSNEPALPEAVRPADIQTLRPSITES